MIDKHLMWISGWLGAAALTAAALVPYPDGFSVEATEYSAPDHLEQHDLRSLTQANPQRVGGAERTTSSQYPQKPPTRTRPDSVRVQRKPVTLASVVKRLEIVQFNRDIRVADATGEERPTKPRAIHLRTYREVMQEYEIITKKRSCMRTRKRNHDTSLVIEKQMD